MIEKLKNIAIDDEIDESKSSVIQEFNDNYRILFLVCLSRLIDKIAPWFDPEEYQLYSVDLNIANPNIDMKFININTKDIRLKPVSSEWFYGEIKENHPDVMQDIQELIDGFIKDLDLENAVSVEK